MNHTRIQQLLASYGADPTRWPAAERPSDQQLDSALAQNHVLAAALADAQVVDAALLAADRVDNSAADVDELHTQRLLRSLLGRLGEFPQADAAHASQARTDGATGAQWLAPDLPRTVHARANRAQPRSTFTLAWVAMLPLLIGFVVGSTGGVNTTSALFEAALEQTTDDEAGGVDVRYADEATMAPFIVAAEFDTQSGVHN